MRKQISEVIGRQQDSLIQYVLRIFAVDGALQVLGREATRARGAAGPQHEDAARGCGSLFTCCQTDVFLENRDSIPISNSCSQRA